MRALEKTYLERLGKTLSSPRLATVGALVLAALISVALSDHFGWGAHPFQGDGHYYFLQTYSLLADGDLDFTNEFALFGDPFNSAEHPVLRGAGNAILWMPFFYLAGAFGWLSGADSTEQMARVFFYGCRVGTAFYALCTVVLLYRAPLARRLPAVERLVGTLLVSLSVPLAHYTFRYPLYNHVLVAFLCTAVMHYSDDAAQTKEKPLRRDHLVGGLLGLLAITRPEFCLLGVVYLVAAPGQLRSSTLRKRLERLVVGAIPALLLQAIISVLTREPPFSGTQLGEPRLFDVLFGPRNGLFYQAPLLYLALFGLIVAAWKERVARVMLFTFLAIALVQSTVWDFWGGASYGPRRFLPFVGFWSWGVWKLLKKLKAMQKQVSLRSFAWLMLALSSAYGATQFTQRRMLATEGGERPRENLLEQVVGSVTGAPLVVYRSLTEGVGFAQARRLTWYHLALRWGHQHGRKWQRVSAEDATFDDCLVESQATGSNISWRFLLPLHRTPVDFIAIKTTGEAPSAVRVGGSPAPLESQQKDGMTVFQVPKDEFDVWMHLDITAPRNTKIRQLILFLDDPHS